MDKFENALRSYFISETNIAPAQTPASYHPPSTDWLPYYLVCSEQLLAIRAATTFKEKYTLNSERDMLIGQLQLCARLPHNVAARLILFQSLVSLNEIRPNIVSEFKERINTLQKENPLPPRQQAVLNRLLERIFPQAAR